MLTLKRFSTLFCSAFALALGMASQPMLSAARAVPASAAAAAAVAAVGARVSTAPAGGPSVFADHSPKTPASAASTASSRSKHSHDSDRSESSTPPDSAKHAAASNKHRKSHARDTSDDESSESETASERRSRKRRSARNNDQNTLINLSGVTNTIDKGFRRSIKAVEKVGTDMIKAVNDNAQNITGTFNVEKFSKSIGNTIDCRGIFRHIAYYTLCFAWTSAGLLMIYRDEPPYDSRRYGLGMAVAGTTGLIFSKNILGN